MKQCFSCGEKIYGETLIHPPCARRIFNADYLPVVDLSMDEIPGLYQGSSGHFSISNLQPEILLTFNRYWKEMEKKGRKPAFILKPPVKGIKNLVFNQNLCMSIAERLEVGIPRHSLIKLKNDHTVCLIIKRFDRSKKRKLGTKTFSQLLEREDKHDGTLEEIGDKIRRISEIPGLDVQLFFEMVLLSFLLGHSDLHLDKFTVLHDKRKKNVRLAPLRDIVSTKLFRPDEEEFSLPMLGKTNNFTGEDFLEFSRYLKIYPKSYDKIFLRLFRGKRFISRLIKNSPLEMDEKLQLSDIVNDRFKRLMT